MINRESIVKAADYRLKKILKICTSNTGTPALLMKVLETETSKLNTLKASKMALKYTGIICYYKKIHIIIASQIGQTYKVKNNHLLYVIVLNSFFKSLV